MRKNMILLTKITNILRNTNRIQTKRNITTTIINLQEKDIMKQTDFEQLKEKNKDTYLEMIRIFVNRDQIYRRGHVEFIYSALKSMKTYGVEKDLEVYRSLIDILPKGKFVAQNVFQAEFMHYPKQQQCIIDLLQQMEDNGVIPDADMQPLLINIFGRRAFPLRKYWRMMYWMPKFKNLSPWALPDKLPNDSLELAKLAINRIASVDAQSELVVYQTSEIEDSIDNTWIVSSQSPIQRFLLKKHPIKEPVYVEGAFKIWIKEQLVNYFILRSAAKKLPNNKDADLDDVRNIKASFLNLKPPSFKLPIEQISVHEQEDGTILAVCATGSSSKDSLLSWIRHLEKTNPALADLPIVFTLRSPSKELASSTADEESQVQA